MARKVQRTGLTGGKKKDAAFRGKEKRLGDKKERLQSPLKSRHRKKRGLVGANCWREKKELFEKKQGIGTEWETTTIQKGKRGRSCPFDQHLTQGATGLSPGRGCGPYFLRKKALSPRERIL